MRSGMPGKVSPMAFTNAWIRAFAASMKGDIEEVQSSTTKTSSEAVSNSFLSIAVKVHIVSEQNGPKYSNDGDSTGDLA